MLLPQMLQGVVKLLYFPEIVTDLILYMHVHAIKGVSTIEATQAAASVILAKI